MENKDIFDTSSLLITVDGPDGSGKSTFSEILTLQLQKEIGQEAVILVKPTRFDASDRSREIGKELEKSGNLREDSLEHNSFFLDALHLNYENVICPFLKQGKIIVVDSSEIRSLAYILERGSIEARDDTIKKIRNGFLTNYIRAGNRIVLKASPQELLKNLSKRDKQDKADPRSIKEAELRISSYETAVRLIKLFQGSAGVRWFFIETKHTPSSIHGYWISKIKEKGLISFFNQ